MSLDLIPQELRMSRNQYGVAKNSYQGEYLKVLFVCSAGVLRSATAAAIFAGEPYNWNTRTCGVTREYALTFPNQALVEWADVIICMEPYHTQLLLQYYKGYEEKVITLNIPDDFSYRDPELIEMLKAQITPFNITKT